MHQPDAELGTCEGGETHAYVHTVWGFGNVGKSAREQGGEALVHVCIHESPRESVCAPSVSGV